MNKKLSRVVDLCKLLKNKSFFLFGPRGAGKSKLIETDLPGTLVYDLLHAPTFERLARRPTVIEEESKPGGLVVIDEVQKLPKLLDEAHRLIEKRSVRFLLTGSSARKLKRGGANLLAGRAREARLFPLVTAEIPHFDLMRYLSVGGLPGIYLSDEPWEDLKAYTGTYLREEIQAEGTVRRFDSFVKFLDLAATKVGEEVNYESLGGDCGVSGRTISSYFEVLEDTLIGLMLHPYQKTRKRKATARAKFYLFDTGVSNALLGTREIVPSTSLFGTRFEQFIGLEMRAYLSYRRRDETLSFWRSQSGFEVDFIVGDRIAIEVKATELVQDRDLKGLLALKEEAIFEDYIVVSRDPRRRVIKGVTILPWQEFCTELWGDRIV